MSYNIYNNFYSRQSVWILRMHLDFCALSYGTTNSAGVCNATDAEKCYNTFYTCKSREDYWTEMKTAAEGEKWYNELVYTSVDANIPHTITFLNYLGHVIKPYLRSVDINAGRITALGYESGNASISLIDSDDEAPELDPYYNTRQSYGTYFEKLMARYPNMKNRIIQVYRAYFPISGDVGDISLTSKLFFVGYIEGVDLKNGIFEIKANDIMAYVFRQTIPKKHSARLIDIPAGGI